MARNGHALTDAKTASKTKDGLNPKQEAFCQFYVNADRELFGNGTQCYLEVYSKDYYRKHHKPLGYLSAMALASQLLRNLKVIGRINELLETGGFNDENVDKQHLFLINQHADLKTKMAAIREYNELKQRVKSKLPPGGNTYNLNIFTDERAARIARRVLNGDSSGEELSR